jgi:hypothetical protein
MWIAGARGGGVRASSPESASRPVEVGKRQEGMDRMNRRTKMNNAAARSLSPAA